MFLPRLQSRQPQRQVEVRLPSLLGQSQTNTNLFDTDCHHWWAPLKPLDMRHHRFLETVNAGLFGLVSEQFCTHSIIGM